MTTDTHNATTEYQRANIEYQRAKTEVEAQLKRLRQALRKHARKQATRPQDYGFAGDLLYARSELRSLVSFFVGPE